MPMDDNISLQAAFTQKPLRFQGSFDAKISKLGKMPMPNEWKHLIGAADLSVAYDELSGELLFFFDDDFFFLEPDIKRRQQKLISFYEKNKKGLKRAWLNPAGYIYDVKVGSARERSVSIPPNAIKYQSSDLNEDPFLEPIDVRLEGKGHYFVVRDLAGAWKRHDPRHLESCHHGKPAQAKRVFALSTTIYSIRNNSILNVLERRLFTSAIKGRPLDRGQSPIDLVSGGALDVRHPK